MISEGEGFILDDTQIKVENIGFVDGAVIQDRQGRELVSVSGYDEYSFRVGNVVSYKIVPNKNLVYLTVDWGCFVAK